MTVAYVDANQFAALWLKSKSLIELSKLAGYAQGDLSTVMRRRRAVEKQLSIVLPAHRDMRAGNFPVYHNVNLTTQKPTIFLVGSDRHNMPGDTPQAFTAFLALAENLKPDYIVINGDWFDFSSIGRFHRIGWQERPSPSEELEDGTGKLRDIELASPKSKRIFVPGNHDMRFDGIIGNRLPEFENIKGSSLAHHLPRWAITQSININDCCIIKHRYHSGQHANYNNVLRGGVNVVTGHTHRLQIEPWTDYRGIRYGVETGMLSDMWDETFMYKENNPSNWQPGCAVVTIDNNLIFPEICPMVVDNNHRRKGKIHYHGQWYG